MLTYHTSVELSLLLTQFHNLYRGGPERGENCWLRFQKSPKIPWERDCRREWPRSWGRSHSWPSGREPRGEMLEKYFTGTVHRFMKSRSSIWNIWGLNDLSGSRRHACVWGEGDWQAVCIEGSCYYTPGTWWYIIRVRFTWKQVLSYNILHLWKRPKGMMGSLSDSRKMRRVSAALWIDTVGDSCEFMFNIYVMYTVIHSPHRYWFCDPPTCGSPVSNQSLSCKISALNPG